MKKSRWYNIAKEIGNASGGELYSAYVAILILLIFPVIGIMKIIELGPINAVIEAWNGISYTIYMTWPFFVVLLIITIPMIVSLLCLEYIRAVDKENGNK